jgi:hypothetical protein
MKVSQDGGQTWIPVLPGVPGPKGDPGTGFIVLDAGQEVPPGTPEGTIVFVRV